MLVPALIRKDELAALYATASFNPKNKYYFSGRNIEYTVTPHDCEWEGLSFVSVNDADKVIGFIAVRFNRNANYAYNLSLLGFYKEPNLSDSLTLANDLGEFIRNLFVMYGMSKLNFNVLVGNPVEKSYDALCTKLGGRIIGTFKQDTVIRDGTLCDIKHYEIMAHEFMASRSITVEEPVDNTTALY